MWDMLLKKKKKKKRVQSSPEYFSGSIPSSPITTDIIFNRDFILDAVCRSDDVRTRDTIWNQKKAVLIYVDNLVEKKMLQDKVLEPLQTSQATSLPEAVPVAVLVRVTDFKDAVTKLIRGYALLLIDQEAAIYCSNVSKTKGRTIEEPGNEQIIRGSHEGFVENVDLNLYLVRLRIQNPNLVVKYHSVSETAPRNVSLLYINGLTNPKIVQLVEQKLKTIRVDFAAAPGTLQDYLDENPASLFPQFILTERPDRVAAHLMEGRVALLMQGSASALILPVTFFTFFQSPDDYNSRWMQGSFFRILRFISFWLATTLPAFYISVVSYQYEIIPIDLTYIIKSSLENIPFPPIIEALFMVVVLELLKEAAIRLPKSIAQTIGIVGGLVIGTAVVQASFVSNAMIIVIALTAISSFCVPMAEMGSSLRLISFPMMLGATLFGFLGIAFCFIILIMHLCKMQNYGSPYFYPLAPLRIASLKDALVRFPQWTMKKRSNDALPQERLNERE